MATGDVSSGAGSMIVDRKEDEKPIDDVDAEIEAMRRKVREMEEEAKRINDIQSQVEKEIGAAAENKEEIDARSVYVGNVDYASTPEELQAHFQSCGTINRVTILCDRFTGHPKGFAYIEFADRESVNNSLVLNDTLFRGRQLKVITKRTNVPGMGRGHRPPMQRGFRPYGFRPYRPYRGGFRARRPYHPYNMY